MKLIIVLGTIGVKHITVDRDDALTWPFCSLESQHELAPFEFKFPFVENLFKLALHLPQVELGANLPTDEAHEPPTTELLQNTKVLVAKQAFDIRL